MYLSLLYLVYYRYIRSSMTKIFKVLYYPNSMIYKYLLIEFDWIIFLDYFISFTAFFWENILRGQSSEKIHRNIVLSWQRSLSLLSSYKFLVSNVKMLCSSIRICRKDSNFKQWLKKKTMSSKLHLSDVSL